MVNIITFVIVCIFELVLFIGLGCLIVKLMKNSENNCGVIIAASCACVVLIFNLVWVFDQYWPIPYIDLGMLISNHQ